MKYIRIILIILTSLIALTSYAYRPMIYNINGHDITHKEGCYLNAGEFMNGVVCASPDEISDATLYIKSIYEQPEYTVLMLQVEYKKIDNSKRPTEWYVATYEKDKPGVIDAILAGSDGDIIYANAQLVFRDSGYDFIPKQTECSIWRDYASVSRNYTTAMGLRGGDETVEKGSITWKFNINRHGIITLPADSITQKAVITVKPNASIPGRNVNPGEISSYNESNQCSTVGPGMTVFNLIMTPISDKNTPQHFEDRYNYLEHEKLPRQESERLNRIVTEWQKRFIYRDATTWLNWMRENPDSHVMANMKSDAKADSAFASFLNDQVKNLNKKERKWWQKQLK